MARTSNQSYKPTRNTPVIYGLVDPRDGLFRYVGQAVDVEVRFKQHLSGTSLDGNIAKALWLRELRQTGVRPECRILEECDDFLEADEAERKWIHRLIEEDHPIINVAQGGAGVRGSSKIRHTRKRDWIELGYTLKCAHSATQTALADLSGMLPKSAPEVRLLRKAEQALGSVKCKLEDRLYTQFPGWNDVAKALYGVPEEHLTRVVNQLSSESIGEDPD